MYKTEKITAAYRKDWLQVDLIHKRKQHKNVLFEEFNQDISNLFSHILSNKVPISHLQTSRKSENA